MTGNVTQPDQAEGERGDEPGADKAAGNAAGKGQGVSSTAPVEGGDDSPVGGENSPG